MTNVITSTHGLELRRWRWRYGTHYRDAPFGEHRKLDGEYMTTIDQLDGYYPGDHRGCLCVAVPELRRRDDQRA
jgi:hypothetical protein